MSEPLWQIMHDANCSSPLRRGADGSLAAGGLAAEIRAVAREIAKRDPDNTMSALAVEEWLLTEADRAEERK